MSNYIEHAAVDTDDDNNVKPDRYDDIDVTDMDYIDHDLIDDEEDEDCYCD